MRMKINWPAEKNTEFGEDVARQQVGKTIPVNLPGGVVHGKVVSAKWARKNIELELELEGEE